MGFHHRLAGWHIWIFIFNRILNPHVFTSGFQWLVSLATHKGIYGEGEPGLIHFNVFWPNMAEIITAAPFISAVFLAGVVLALARMLSSGRYLDPISLTLVASFLAFAAQLVATSKHFNLHYMMASWALAGGVLVLTVIEVRRLFPKVSPRVATGVAAAVYGCASCSRRRCFKSRARPAPGSLSTTPEPNCPRRLSRPARPAPDYALDESTWERISCAPFLDTSQTSLLARTIWIPDLPLIPAKHRRKWGEHCLLRRR